MGAGFRPSRAPILLGIVPAIGGGLIRDVLAGREYRLMERELDAIPVSAGCLTTAVLITARPQVDNLIALACIGFIVLFRGGAIHWKLEVPDWLRMSTSQREPEATIHPQIPDRTEPHPSESITHRFIPIDTGNHPRCRAILLRLRRRIGPRWSESMRWTLFSSRAGCPVTPDRAAISGAAETRRRIR